MKDYCNLYLKCGVLLLADVFEQFRNNSFKNYRLCPSHYLSSPGLCWDVMLKTTEIKLGFILNSLKKVQEVEFLIFVIDTTKPAINITTLMTQNKNENILFT